MEPHPYVALGAPYGENLNPWYLREGVIKQLISAEDCLKDIRPELGLAVFDAWRPISVQAFMVEHTINEQCSIRGVNRKDQGQISQFKKIEEDVSKFWAPASLDKSYPSPHSTGAAIDLTLSDSLGKPLDLGGKIDEIGPISEPNYYLDISNLETNCKESLWHRRRVLLSDVMTRNGFVQHPNEWWHFSFGDQLWAWKFNLPEAIYGTCSP